MMNFEFGGEVLISEAEMDAIVQEAGKAIPEKCRHCPMQGDLEGQLTQMLINKHVATKVAQDFMGPSGDSFDAAIDNNAPSEIAEEFKSFPRSILAESLDSIDEDIDAVGGTMQESAASCSGPLKMRAPKLGTTYTATICTSSEVYSNDGLSYQITRVEAQDK